MPPLPKTPAAPGAAAAASPSSTALELPDPATPAPGVPAAASAPPAGPEPDNLSSRALAVPPPPPAVPDEQTPSPASGINVGAAPPWRPLHHDALAPPLPGSTRKGVRPTPFVAAAPAGSAFLPSPAAPGAPASARFPAWALKGVVFAVVGVIGLLVARHYISVAASDALRKDTVVFNDAIVRMDAELVQEAKGFGRVLASCVEGKASIDDLGPRLANLQRIIGKAESDHRTLKQPAGGRDLMEASRALLAVERRIWFDDVPKLINALQMADPASREKLLADAVESLSRAEAEAMAKREAVKAAQKAFAEKNGFDLKPGGS